MKAPKQAVQWAVTISGQHSYIAAKFQHHSFYSVSKKRPPFYFSNNCRKLTDFNDF